MASDDGNRVAVIDGFNITFLSRDNAFANAIGTSTSKHQGISSVCNNQLYIS